MRLSEILQGMQGSAGEWRAQVPEDWAQGRSLFGGIQVAVALRAMRALVDARVPLRTLQVSFIAPLPPGELRVQCVVLRAGKSATQVEARMYDGAQLACLAVGIFGAARESVLAIDLPATAPDREAAALKPMPYLAGAMPAFLQHTDMRWARGSLPFMGGSDPRAQIWVRLKGETGCDECTVVALADTPPPLGLTLLKKPAPGSSMTWMLEFFRHDFPQGEGFWLLDAQLSAARDGYTSQTLTMYDPQLRPVALSRQSMVVFA